MGSEELRARFLKAESSLFRIRFDTDDAAEKQRFLDSMDFDWVLVSYSKHSQRIIANFEQTRSIMLKRMNSRKSYKPLHSYSQMPSSTMNLSSK